MFNCKIAYLRCTMERISAFVQESAQLTAHYCRFTTLKALCLRAALRQPHIILHDSTISLFTYDALESGLLIILYRRGREA